MSFSTPLFLFIIFPITYIGYYFLPQRLKNGWLLFWSLIFYAWSGIEFLFILLVFTIMNYILGRLIENNKKRSLLTFAIVCNLSILLIYKYANFILTNVIALIPVNISMVLRGVELTQNLIMPMGLSFFTFRGISYIVDIYKDKIKACKNWNIFLLYMVMFPYIISGPIVRYADVGNTIMTSKKLDSETIIKVLNALSMVLEKKFWSLMYWERWQQRYLHQMVLLCHGWG